jgi:hypothetical protein
MFVQCFILGGVCFLGYLIVGKNGFVECFVLGKDRFLGYLILGKKLSFSASY